MNVIVTGISQWIINFVLNEFIFWRVWQRIGEFSNGMNEFSIVVIVNYWMLESLFICWNNASRVIQIRFSIELLASPLSLSVITFDSIRCFFSFSVALFTYLALSISFAIWKFIKRMIRTLFLYICIWTRCHCQSVHCAEHCIAARVCPIYLANGTRVGAMQTLYKKLNGQLKDEQKHVHT